MFPGSLGKKRLDLWLPTYALTAPRRALGSLGRRRRLTHIILLVCDHYEPRHGLKHEGQPAERVGIWRDQYAQFQAKCRASFGASPVHTFFYPPHHGMEHLASLSDMVFEGLGEVELHYHHDGDTAETLRAALRTALAQYHRWGLLLTSGARPRTSFGFVHGDWALDNSRAGKYCGVNDELTLLQELGCWADFTMPSANDAQTRKINSIYYARGNAQHAKSHDSGRDAAVGNPDPPGLFLMQGPLGINWLAPGYPRIENASLTSENWGRPDRIRKWLDCHVHVKGRPEWLFVKLHTHGAIERDFDALFGGKAFEMQRILNEQYNDGRQFRLHYVTARQAYNIAKAAEHGKQGDPSEWLDYLLPPQPHSFYTIDAPHDLMHCSREGLLIEGIDADRVVYLRTRIGPVEALRGKLSGVEIDSAGECVRVHVPAAATEVELQLDPTFQVLRLENARIIRQSDGPARTWRLLVEPRSVIHYQKSTVDLPKTSAGGGRRI